jgi:hypothetical protein
MNLHILRHSPIFSVSFNEFSVKHEFESHYNKLFETYL